MLRVESHFRLQPTRAGLCRVLGKSMRGEDIRYSGYGDAVSEECKNGQIGQNPIQRRLNKMQKPGQAN